MATPRKEKPAETPGYWPTTKMAELFELTARRIQQLTQDGVLKTHDTPAGAGTMSARQQRTTSDTCARSSIAKRQLKTISWRPTSCRLR